MLDGLKHISKRTDVYLLGACLFELISGRGPHAADSVREALEHVVRPITFDFDTSVPKELANICIKALAYSPDERWEDVGVFKTALEDYLLHRISIEMSREAADKLDALRQLIREFSDGKNLDEDVSTLKVWPTFNECRFGFEQALKQWPENNNAKQDLQTTISLMAEWEIERSLLQSAEVLFAELDEPTTELIQKLKQLRKTISSDEDRRAELERLAFEQDARIGAKERIRFMLALIPVTTILIGIVYLGAKRSGQETTSLDLLYYLLFTIVITSIAGYKFRKAFWANERSRHITKTLILMFAGILLTRLVGVFLDQPAAVTLRDEFFVITSIFSMIALSHYKTAWCIVALLLIGIVTTVLIPEHILEIYIACHTGIVVGSLVIFGMEAKSVADG
jgi:eukaryotic-like serine/threonine-protein kinase